MLVPINLNLKRSYRDETTGKRINFEFIGVIFS